MLFRSSTAIAGILPCCNDRLLSLYDTHLQLFNIGDVYKRQMLDRLQAQRTAADAERLESVQQEIGKLRRRVYELEQMLSLIHISRLRLQARPGG